MNRLINYKDHLTIGYFIFKLEGKMSLLKIKLQLIINLQLFSIQFNSEILNINGDTFV